MIEREEDGYVSLCLEFAVAGQGDSLTSITGQSHLPAHLPGSLFEV
jgi:hypothetical protein